MENAREKEVLVRCYEDTNFGGHHHPIVFQLNPPEVPENRIQSLGGVPEIHEKMSSLKWRVPPGAAVIFVEHGHIQNPGKTFTCIGAGEDKNLHSHKDSLGDTFQGWYWTRIGRQESASTGVSGSPE